VLPYLGKDVPQESQIHWLTLFFELPDGWFLEFLELPE
jgi:hypothetical protein